MKTPKWLSPETAPKDGSLLRLSVQFDEHPMDDDTGPPQVTIGMNNVGNTGVDEWQFAGWCWTHDRFTQGEGTVVGWLPLLDTDAAALDDIAEAIERAVDCRPANEVLGATAGCLVGLVEALAEQAGADPSKAVTLQAGAGSRDVTIHERNPDN